MVRVMKLPAICALMIVAVKALVSMVRNNRQLFTSELVAAYYRLLYILCMKKVLNSIYTIDMDFKCQESWSDGNELLEIKIP